MGYSTINPITIDTINQYVLRGRPTGGFCQAVLANDLIKAVNRADIDNAAHLADIVRYCYWEIPGPCWGSYDTYEKWLKMTPAEREPIIRDFRRRLEEKETP